MTDGENEIPVSDLPEELTVRIDSALIANAGKRFQKVAMVVARAMTSVPDAPKNLPRAYFLQRIAHLARTSKMETRGDLSEMGSSEVRLPSPPLSEAELDQMIAKRDYWKLACCYADGQGVPQDYAAALCWHCMAAEQGEVWSQFNVGRFYLNGYGVDQNFIEAYFWISLAASRSSNKHAFEQWRKEVALKLDPEQRAEVDKRVAEWKPKPAG